MRKIILFILAILMIAIPGQTADIKMSAFTTGTAIVDTDYLIYLYYTGGQYYNRKITMTNLKTVLQPLDADLTALAGLTSAANAIPYFTGSGTAGVISSNAGVVTFLGTALGAADSLVGVNSAGTALEYKTSLSISSLNLTSATSSIPSTVTTSTGAQTAAGQQHFESDTYIWSIGDGDATPISLDFAKDAVYTFPTATSTLAILGANTFTADQTITGAILPEAANTRAIGSTSAEWADIYLGDGAIIYGQNDQSNTITSSATGWSFAKAITIADVSNDNYVKITNNASREPTASVNELYPEGNVWKMNSNGVETTIASVKNEKLASFSWDGGASPVATASSKRCVAIPYAATIVGWTMVISGDPGAGGSILNITKDAYSDSALPTTEIDASAPPTVADNKVAATDATLTGWTVAVTANDIICADVATNAVATWISLTIYGTK